MPEFDTSDFQRRLKLIKNWSDQAILTGLEASADQVITHIKKTQTHLRGKSLSRGVVREHPHEHFYVWSQRLINSLYPSGEIQSRARGTATGAYVEVGAQEPYASIVERGGAGRRAFPFLGPALGATEAANLQIMANALKRVLS